MKKIFTIILIFGFISGGFAQDREEKEYDYPPFQVTFFPPLGTNGINCGNAVNKLSFNILAGYSAGLEGFELGCFLNGERDFVHGIQIAGFSNLVGGNVFGVQVAGFANANLGKAYGTQVSGFANLSGEMKGVQVGGFANLSLGKALGTQVAGFANVSIGSLKGFQVAGHGNLAVGNVEGLQISGFANIATGKVKGGQISGFANLATANVKGSQISGYANISIGDVKGVQVSGFGNLATGDVKGIQVSGFANYAKDLDGVQVGVINYCKNADKGIPIGVLSIVKDGLRQVELSGGETLHGNVAFKTGVDHFYNIFALGMNFKDEDVRWGPGYGVGTFLKITPSFLANIELMSYHIVEEWDNRWRGFWERNDLNLLNQAKFNLVLRMGNHFSIFGGGTFNVMVSQYKSSDCECGSDIAPWTIYDKTKRNTNVKMWPGFNFGIRIRN